MRIGILSDIHANHLALEAALARCDALGVDRLVILGDIVGYGAEPEAAVARVMALQAQGAIVIRGNHDAAIATPDAAMNSLARAAIDWTRPRLSAEAKGFLAGLPMTHEIEGMLFVHADASAPSRWNYVLDAASAHASLAATTAQLTVCGHVHRPQLYCYTATAKVVRHQPEIGVSIPLAPHRRWLAVVGAVGQPRDGNPGAGFAIIDTAARDITYLRAPYDHEAAASKIRAAGLPEQLALRLEAGQ